MLTNASPAALLAVSVLTAMLTDAATATILATVPHPAMHTEGAPAALLAAAAYAAMLTNAGAATLLAAVAPAAMFAPARLRGGRLHGYRPMCCRRRPTALYPRNWQATTVSHGRRSGFDTASSFSVGVIISLTSSGRGRCNQRVVPRW